MAKFEDAIYYVLDNEGGYAEHPSDPGGPTYWGISLRYLKGKGKGDIDGDGDIDADDIRELTKAQAIEFYQKDFWDKLKLEKLKAQAVATRVFDMAVNMGPKGAVKIAQRAFNGLLEGDDKEDRLKVDGKLGPKTRKALDSIDPVEMMDSLRLFHAEFYRDLVKRNPKLKAFLVGWLRRAGR